MKAERTFTSDGTRLTAGCGAGSPILVVDDSRLQRRVLSSQLRRLGHEVLEAETGTEALEIVRQRAISIVISDWMMPGMNGLGLCRALRGAHSNAYVYFILLTSKGEKNEIAEGLDAGADDFLTKPVNGNELRARIVAGQRILTMQQELRDALGQLQGLYEAIDRDLVEARRLQASLVREPSLLPPGCAVDMFLQSSGRVGGDLVGTYPISEHEIGLYSLDVSGHGIASALLGARIAGQLSPTSPEQNIAFEAVEGGYRVIAPHRVVGRLNALFLGEIDTEHYFTICLAHADLQRGRIDFCQAGHPGPILRRSGGGTVFCGNGGLPVGLIEGAEYQLTSIAVQPGDAFLIYSDGLTEQQDAEGAFFGEDRLAAAFSALDPNAPVPVFDLLCRDLARFTGTGSFSDDVSGLVLSLSGSSSAVRPSRGRTRRS